MTNPTNKLLRLHDAKNESHIPIVFLPGAATTPLSLSTLAKHIGVERSVYSTVYSGLSANTSAQSDVTRIAESLVATVLSEHANQEVALGGFCFGGIVALETGRQLLQADIGVPRIVLIDSFAPPRRKNVSSNEIILCESQYDQTFDQVQKLRDEKMEKNLSRLTQQTADRVRQAMMAHNQAGKNHVATPVSCPINLIYTKAEDREFHQNWANLTTDAFSMDQVSCDSDEILAEPHAQTVAALVNGMLSD